MPEYGSANNIWEFLAEWAATQPPEVAMDLANKLERKFPRFHRARFDVAVKSWITLRQPPLFYGQVAQREALAQRGIELNYQNGWFWCRATNKKSQYGPFRSFNEASDDAMMKNNIKGTRAR